MDSWVHFRLYRRTVIRGEVLHIEDLDEDEFVSLQLLVSTRESVCVFKDVLRKRMSWERFVE